MDNTSNVVSVMANAIVNGDWDELPEMHKILALSQARNVLEAIRSAGYVVVPVEPTEAMLETSWRLTGESGEMRNRTVGRMARHYKAMIAAAEGGE